MVTVKDLCIAIYGKKDEAREGSYVRAREGSYTHTRAHTVVASQHTVVKDKATPHKKQTSF